MTDIGLTDNQWTKIRDFLLEEPNAYVGKDEASCRHFDQAIKWVSRSGAQWRLLPTEYGKWNTIYKRFVRWCEHGVWQRMFEYFADDPDMENGMIDSIIVRAHPCASSAQKRGEQALGSSRGGLGNPLRFCLTAGQISLDNTSKQDCWTKYSTDHLEAHLMFAHEVFNSGNKFM